MPYLQQAAEVAGAELIGRTAINHDVGFSTRIIRGHDPAQAAQHLIHLGHVVAPLVLCPRVPFSASTGFILP